MRRIKFYKAFYGQANRPRRVRFSGLDLFRGSGRLKKEVMMENELKITMQTDGSYTTNLDAGVCSCCIGGGRRVKTLNFVRADTVRPVYSDEPCTACGGTGKQPPIVLRIDLSMTKIITGQ